MSTDEITHAVAKSLWDDFEAGYWHHEVDHRPFDPTITELDSDDCDRGAGLLDEVTETLKRALPLIEASHHAAIRALATRWATVADLCNEEGIETPTMPIRAAVADLLGLLEEGE